MIACLEGGDAVGKATQSKILAKRLNAELFSFPSYETAAGRAILSNLKSEWSAARRYVRSEPKLRIDELRTDAADNALVLQSLMLTNRMERSADLWVAARRGHVVLDRYDASSFVYGKIDGIDPAWLRQANEQLPVRPDLYVLIDVPVDEGFRRRPERRDRYETDRTKLERVREEYLRLFAERQEERVGPKGLSRDQILKLSEGRLGVTTSARWVVVDGLGTVEEVSARIWRVCVEAGA